MILPVLKFVLFSLAPFLLLIWTTSPNLWSQISSSACLVGDNPSSLLHLPGGLLISGEALVKSLTCYNLDLHTADHALTASVVEEMLVSSLPSLEENELMPLQAPVMLPPAPTCTPWLLTGLVLMGLNVYFLHSYSLCSFCGPPFEWLSQYSTGQHLGGKALFYLVKLGSIIWWAMPVPASTPPSPEVASQYSWYPDDI
ncbi:hypothetical protein DSO57_1011411 [Entomophthora muscae]|uniref:Uncharacterized protein n=1 Tax=Entomophthora muscae TaxID=34485 RepID=A0ACC2UFX1_9FUNG|nr:hypothetical protein DSO57_1011411 [Entomophthora muscae]